MVGRVFVRWTVLALDKIDTHYRKSWICRCECGRKRSVDASDLKHGRSQSCGCIRVPTRTHGDSRSPEWTAWVHIIQRCENRNCRSFKNYGARGINICPEWRNDYTKFLDYVGRRPTLDHTIERIDNDGNYEPGNVRWATRLEQSRNRRVNRIITHDGKTKCLTAWAELLGVTYQTLQKRLKDGRRIDGTRTL